MKGYRLFCTMIIVGVMLGSSMPVSAQFVTLARKIKSKLTEGKEVAIVILDAGASKVYKAVNDTLASSPRFMVQARDNQRREVKFMHDEITLSVLVDSLSAGYSRITVEAEPAKNTQPKQTDAAVKAILAVCHKVGLTCTQKDVETNSP